MNNNKQYYYHHSHHFNDGDDPDYFNPIKANCFGMCIKAENCRKNTSPPFNQYIFELCQKKCVNNYNNITEKCNFDLKNVNDKDPKACSEVLTRCNFHSDM